MLKRFNLRFNRLRHYSALAFKEKKKIGTWYLSSAGLVFGIVVLGGLTRLTESGLSITEWNLVKGIQYPSNLMEWEQEFNKYKESPEGIMLNKNISIEEFKNIFFMEWAHRIWGYI
jgi:cytochrome c oxidase assembly protein subunit 15